MPKVEYILNPAFSSISPFPVVTIYSGFSSGEVRYEIVELPTYLQTITIISTKGSNSSQVRNVSSSKLTIELLNRRRYAVRVKSTGIISEWVEFQTPDKDYKTPDIYTRTTQLSSKSFSLNKRTTSQKVRIGDSMVRVKRFGFSKTDSTLFINQALSSSANVLYFESGDWNVSSTINVPSNKELVFNKNARMIARSGYFTDDGTLDHFNADVLMALTGVSNITIRGNATFKMQENEYTTGEWRHCVRIIHSKNIEVDGLTLQGSGGDGIYISELFGDAAYDGMPRTRNIVVKNCICQNHRRNGISITSGENITIDSCVFRNQNTVLPKSGVDIEPFDELRQVIKNVIIKNSKAYDNAGKGFICAMGGFGGSAEPISVIFINCEGYRNDVNFSSLIPNGTESSVGGELLLERCTSYDSLNTGTSFRGYSPGGFNTTFRDCDFHTGLQEPGETWHQLALSLVSNGEPLLIGGDDSLNPVKFTFENTTIWHKNLTYENDGRQYALLWSLVPYGGGVGTTDINGSLTVCSIVPDPVWRVAANSGHDSNDLSSLDINIEEI